MVNITSSDYEAHKFDTLLYYSSNQSYKIPLKFKNVSKQMNQTFYQIDCLQYQEVCNSSGIRGLPTLSVSYRKQQFMQSFRELLTAEDIASQIREVQSPMLTQQLSLGMV